MASYWTTEQSIRAGETWNWPKLCKSQNLNFIALLCLIFLLPYHWSSWTVYVQQWDWLKGFLLLGTNYDRAWFYDLSLQHHPPTLWARSEGSSVSIGDLHCTLRADSHHDRESIIEINVCLTLRIYHIAKLLTWHAGLINQSGLTRVKD